MRPNVRRLPRIVVSTIVLAFCSVTADARDLHQYDLAGPYSLHRSSRQAEELPIIEAEIRSFLWTRWRKKRLAHMALVQYSLEGRPTRTWYYLEPDKKGDWHLLIDEDITLAAINPASGEHLREAHQYAGSVLERIDPLNREDKSARVIPETESREPESYILRIRDASGKVLADL
jgi:hypothetical protein